MPHTDISRLNGKYTLNMEYIKAVFEESGLSYKSIAVTQGLSDTTVYRFFNGQKSPDFNTAACIIGAIGASFDRAIGIVGADDDETTSRISPDPAAVVYEAVLQSIPSLVDTQEIADQVAGSIKDAMVDEKKIADHVAGQVAGQVADQVAGQVAGQVADQVAGQVADQVAGQVADQVAGQVAQAIKDSPSIPASFDPQEIVLAILDAFDPHDIASDVLAAMPPYPQISEAKLAKAIVDALPASSAKDCDSCRTARIYESTILRQSKLVSALLAAVGSMFLLMALLIVWLLAK